MFLSTTILFALIISNYGANLPSSFKKCSRKQPDFKKCELEAARNGLAQFEHPTFKGINLININPFEIKEITVGGSGAVAVDQKFTNCKLFGFPSGKFEIFDLDLDKNSLRLKVSFSEIKKLCQYQLDGKVLLLPIKGEGQSTVLLGDPVFDGTYKIKQVKKNGKTYVKIVSSEYEFDVGHVHFNFENLFNGDKQLGDNVNQVLNDNWKQVFDEVKSSYSVIVNNVVITAVTSFFSEFSVEELLD